MLLSSKVTIWVNNSWTSCSIYLLLTSFSRSVLLRAWAINRRGKTRIRYLQYDREDEVSKIFMCDGFGKRFLITRNGLKFLTHVESKPSQFEIVVKSSARFNTQFKENTSFKLLFAWKLRTRKFLATKTALNFSGPYSRIRPAKLTNHSALSNSEI